VAKVTLPSLLNGPIEVGLRTLVLLVEAFPEALDLQKLVTFDYFLIHSGDIDGGPPSLHPPSPLRAGEVAIRRGLIEHGLELYRSRGLISQRPSPDGFQYLADDFAASFLDALTSSYAANLRVRAEWIIDRFDELSTSALSRLLDDSMGRWRSEFAVLELEGNDE
jgi:hypothetical protein